MSQILNVVNKFFPGVTTVVDSLHKATIEVTAKDAASRAVKDHNACAMAVACKRRFHLDGVIISRSMAYLIKGTTARRFQLPETVSREVVSFDRGAGFAVGRYELAAVAPQNRLGASKKRTKWRANRDGTPKRKRHITTKVRSVLGGKKPEDE